MDIEADEKVERNIGLEASCVDAEQLEHFSLPVRVEEDGAVEHGEEEVEDDKDDQVVVDQLQHGAPLRHNQLQLSQINPPHLQWLISVKNPVRRRDVSWYLCRYLISGDMVFKTRQGQHYITRLKNVKWAHCFNPAFRILLGTFSNNMVDGIHPWCFHLLQ